MPTSVPRGAPFLLLPPLLMLSAVLAVPVDRAAPHQEDSQATETPVSSSALFSGVLAVAFAIPRALGKTPGIPWFNPLRLVGYLPSFAIVSWRGSKQTGRTFEMWKSRQIPNENPCHTLI